MPSLSSTPSPITPSVGPQRAQRRPMGALLALAAAVALAACGGGDADPATGSSGGGGTGGGAGTLTLSSSNPALHNTTLNLAAAGSTGLLARAADVFSAAAYCEAYWENVPGANGAVYAVQVYFRQSDKAVLHTSIIGTSGGALGWSVYDNAGGAAITGMAITASSRTATYTAKRLAGSGTEGTTVDGSAVYPANSAAPGCSS